MEKKQVSEQLLASLRGLEGAGGLEMVLGEHGMTEIKGKGKMRTFSLRALQASLQSPARVALPAPPAL